ncbi:MAG: hypothetical protein WCR54_02010 [Clostridia bacterium]
MTRSSYITFMAYVTFDKIQLIKLYPEQNGEVSFEKIGHGIIYYYHNKTGLYKKKI